MPSREIFKLLEPVYGTGSTQRVVRWVAHTVSGVRTQGGGSERTADGVEVSVVGLVVEIRKGAVSKQIGTDWRILDMTAWVQYNIQAVVASPPNPRRFLRLHCSTGPGDVRFTDA